ncbi:zinc finger bed domain-containing protein 1-like [Gigaspora margarita]|uniref:Zinc finger bed domain-containing protein 1-like n=1 Tax=Gigaspora margarita TaxID=4874 RepID=A0A8H4AZQ4_GIGMA|nr:zinc finger bed domain-containing protein 1-like [Gigaspora margarita]
MFLDNEDLLDHQDVLYKGFEKKYGHKYKYDGGTENMSYHLRTKHNLIEKNELASKSQQLQIDNMLSKITPHKSAKQNKLRHSISEWLTLIAETCEAASLTTDLWTAHSQDGYYFQQKANEFGLSNKITCIVTDNGANMKKAINSWNSIIRVPCSAHTIQLTVNCALTTIKQYTIRIRRLLNRNLDLFDKPGAKEDARKLNNYILHDYEWEFLCKLVDILQPFDQLTTYFSRIKYVTLSVINSSIEALKYEYANGTELSSEELSQIWNDQEELDNESDSDLFLNKNDIESESDEENINTLHKYNFKNKKY